jgi:hypothetical protein
MRELEVYPAPLATQTQMGSFGSYCAWYSAEFSLGIPEEEAANKVKLQDEQAAKHEERMATDQADMQKRKLALHVMPPLNQPANSLFQVSYGNSALLSSSVPMITNNYLFASQMAVFQMEDPQGRVTSFITCDDEIKSRAEADGLKLVTLEEVKTGRDYDALMARAAHGSLHAGDLPSEAATAEGEGEGCL